MKNNISLVIGYVKLNAINYLNNVPPQEVSHSAEGLSKNHARWVRLEAETCDH